MDGSTIISVVVPVCVALFLFARYLWPSTCLPLLQTVPSGHSVRKRLIALSYDSKLPFSFDERSFKIFSSVSWLKLIHSLLSGHHKYEKTRSLSAFTSSIEIHNSAICKILNKPRPAFNLNNCGQHLAGEDLDRNFVTWDARILNSAFKQSKSQPLAVNISAYLSFITVTFWYKSSNSVWIYDSVSKTFAVLVKNSSLTIRFFFFYHNEAQFTNQ